tara:strand:+ start:7858 stop:8931 length:1074 start_codon:yes stop_codon:yes gene_type:complete
LKYVAGCGGYHGKDGTSPAAEMGTRIHEALEVRDPSALHNDKEVDLYERCAEMEDEFLAETFGDQKRTEHYEIQVDVALDGTSTFGTCDRFTTADEGRIAVMGDYKTGISTIDSPRDNYQAMAYTVGAFQMFPDVETIIFAFYVPQRGAFPQRGTFERSELPELIKKLSDVIKNGEATRPLWGGGQCPPVKSCTPTQNCRFCRHEDRCPALGGLVIDVASNLARKEFTNIDLEKVDDPASVEELFNISKIVAAWADRLKKRAVQMAKDGVEFPNIRLRSMGATSDITDNETMMNIARDMGVDEKTLIESAKFPLRKTADLIGSTADKGLKGEKSSEFIDTCESAGIIKKNETRYTLS